MTMFLFDNSNGYAITELLRRNHARSTIMPTATFQECTNAYLEMCKAKGISQKHIVELYSSLAAYAYPMFGSMPVHQIDADLVVSALAPTWCERPQAANRIRMRVASVLDYAAAYGYRQGENPARWRGHLEYRLPDPRQVHPVRHPPALPHSDIVMLAAKLHQRGGAAARALEFKILTAARTSEVIGARWAEVHTVHKVWTKPRRMGSSRSHRVPLSDAALAILSERKNAAHGDFIFSGANTDCPIGKGAMAEVMKRIGYGEFSVSGFRVTIRTWAVECTLVPGDVVEMVLGHTPRDMYRCFVRTDRFQQRRELMEAWARFVTAEKGAGS
jgi:integrase